MFKNILLKVEREFVLYKDNVEDESSFICMIGYFTHVTEIKDVNISNNQ